MGKCGLTGVVPDHGVLSLACEPPVAKTVFVSIVCSYSIFERLSISLFFQLLADETLLNFLYASTQFTGKEEGDFSRIP